MPIPSFGDVNMDMQSPILRLQTAVRLGNNGIQEWLRLYSQLVELA